MEEIEQVVEWTKDKSAYVWFILLAMWGGTASHLSRMRRMGLKFSLTELIGEWAICGFAGIITAYLCEASNLSFPITAAMSGIAGHMGGRAIYMIQTRFFNVAPFFKAPDDPNGNPQP